MSLRRFRRQYAQMSQFERERIIGMMESGWSARRVARQLGRSDCMVKMYWDQWIREIAFTRRPGSFRPRKTSRREDRHIVRNARAQITASSAAIQAQIVYSDESRFNLSSDDNRVRVGRPLGERLNSAFALQRHTAPTAGVIVWSAITYNTRLLLLLTRDTKAAQWYVHDILKPHVLPLMQRLPGAIFKQCFFSYGKGFTRDSTQLLPFLGLPDLQICVQSSLSGIIWDGELDISPV
ncbi:transposable element Tcb2 transposase [Trichonephila clavipes]|nr:transposable element Tcb2 transposase [Trichonephila clavipes]